MDNYRKKGMVEGAVGSLMTLFIGIAVITLVIIFTGTLGGQTYNLAEPNINSISGSVVNESFTATNNTVITLANDNINEGSISILNGSGVAIGNGNFSINYLGGKLTPNFITPVVENMSGDAMLITYTHGDATIEQYVKDGIISSFKAQKQTADYLPLVALAVIIGLVLVIVVGLGGLTNGGNRGSSL